MIGHQVRGNRIASAPPTVRLLSGVVGAQRIGIMIAWITVIHQIGSAPAAYLAGVLRITFGTYIEAFILSGILLIAAAVATLFIGAVRNGASRRPLQRGALMVSVRPDSAHRERRLPRQLVRPDAV
jgi:hypothetical protein